MKCFKCNKEMDREDGGTIIKGISIDVTRPDILKPPLELDADYEYNKLQLGKYSNNDGECHVAICYECYIDGVFHIKEEGND